MIDFFASQAQSEVSRVFVYGTLRKGDPSGKSALLAPGRWLGEGQVRGLLFDLGAYPGAVPCLENDDWVCGEVVELEDFPRQIEALDRYEGCEDGPLEKIFSRSEYRREVVAVRLDSGATLAAWIYWMNLSSTGLKKIVSGNWLNRQAARWE